MRMNFDAVVEEKIRAAIEEGLFDHLPGKGQPLRLDDNPHEPAAWRLANKILHDHGFTLPWIDERKQIEEAVEKATKSLAQAHRQTHRLKQPDVWARAEWQRAVDKFSETVKKLNKRIRDYNLQAPSDNFHRMLVDAKKEIALVASEAGTDAMWDAAKK